MCVLCKQTYMQRPWVPTDHYSFSSRNLSLEVGVKHSYEKQMLHRYFMHEAVGRALLYLLVFIFIQRMGLMA